MGAEKRLLPVKEAFQLAQQSHQNQAKLVVALSRTYRTVSAPDPEALPEAPDSAHLPPTLLHPPPCGDRRPPPVSPSPTPPSPHPSLPSRLPGGPLAPVGADLGRESRQPGASWVDPELWVTSPTTSHPFSPLPVVNWNHIAKLQVNH